MAQPTCLKSDCCIMFTDASGIGYGGYVRENMDLEMVGSWSELEQKNSSSWREIEALNRALKSFGGSLEGQNVRWYTDNRNVTSIVKKGKQESYSTEHSYGNTRVV